MREIGLLIDREASYAVKLRKSVKFRVTCQKCVLLSVIFLKKSNTERF